MSRLKGALRPRDLGAKAAFVFDLDNTLYPASLTVFDAIGHRMTAFIMRALDLPHAQAFALQEQYHSLYGATVVGLMRHHGVDPFAFMDDVHEVDLSEITPDARLIAALKAYRGRAIVFTNGASSYAARVLARLGVSDYLDAVIALDDIDFIPKPEAVAFVSMARLAQVDPHTAVMFEDSPRNLETAADLGYATVLIGAARPGRGVDFHRPDLHAFLEEVLQPDA
jgi:putative hydrolase of the HAD superfamily